ncbi:MAG: hypothetical protein NTW89_10755 [Burkholderiales bacterium]|nr:hypothetical protein [Burkholderiales bacterium]
MKAMKSMRLAGAALMLATSFGLSSALAQTAAPSLKAPPKQIPAMEQGALDIVKAMSTKLASAKTLRHHTGFKSCCIQ